jgi:hypothetical protein
MALLCPSALSDRRVSVFDMAKNTLVGADGPNWDKLLVLAGALIAVGVIPAKFKPHVALAAAVYAFLR